MVVSVDDGIQARSATDEFHRICVTSSFRSVAQMRKCYNIVGTLLTSFVDEVLSICTFFSVNYYLPYFLPFFPVPPYKPNEGDDGAGATNEVGNGLRQGETFGRDANVSGADQGHEQSGQEGDVKVFSVAHQVNGDGPKGEDGERLVTPRKVAPNNLEPFGIAEAVNEHTDGE